MWSFGLSGGERRVVLAERRTPDGGPGAAAHVRASVVCHGHDDACAG